MGGIAGVGEDFAFRVEATGTPPLSYQWLYQGANLPGATMSTLLLTNLSLSQAGYYAVKVANTNGSAQSAYARLIVQEVFARRLLNGRMLTSTALPQVAVPIVLRGSGRENAVSFSLAYDANAFMNPVFVPGYPYSSVTTSNSQPGVIGLLVSFPPATAFPPGYVPVGLVQFDVAAGANALQGALAFTNAPFPVAATNAAQQALHIFAALEPQHVLVASAPRLDRQSGLFKQQIVVSNPSADVMTNVNVLPVTLGYDLLDNAIEFYNGTAKLYGLPDDDPLVYVDWNCDCGYSLDSTNTDCSFSSFLACATNAYPSVNSANTYVNLVFAQIQNLAPAESRTLTLEYWVSDHLTAPPVLYSVFVDGPLKLSVPSTAEPLSITTNRYINGTFVIEFPTQLDRYYFVQYDSNSTFTNPRTAFPAILGTGSRVQWTDDGPPKTISPPINGSRFYRVLETQ